MTAHIALALLLLLATALVVNSYSPSAPTTMSSSSSKAPAVPRIIQGGMGIRISSWELAREVARKGELGVVSATVIDTVLVRELQSGT